jgi:hypothetical protein
MRYRARLSFAVCIAGFSGTVITSNDQYPANYVAGSLIRLNDNGAWSWFMDPRVIADNGKLIVGSVRAVGSLQANLTDPNSGNIEITRNSTCDNLRPLVPAWDDRRTALVRMRGSYIHNHGEWYSAVVALILPPERP